MNKFLRWFFVFGGILGLIAIRFWENELFYDPLLSFFKLSDKTNAFPNLDWSNLILSHLFRFFMNLCLSAIILHFLFENSRWTLQGIILMLIVFGITFPLYLYFLYTEFQVGQLLSFYVRRFVIQPIILLLIIPIFYYRKHLEK